MFSVAYVILPFSEIPPAEAIRASLAPFQRGMRGDLPETMLAFEDETDYVRRIYQETFTFTEQEKGGMQIQGDPAGAWNLDIEKVRAEMQRLGLSRWRVRFADLMDLDAFFDRFINQLERHPVTGAFGMWRNPLGRWDWWDLGGRFDGAILGERRRTEGRSVATVSSGPSSGRTILANVESALASALGQEPAPQVDVRSDQNIELVATLIEDSRSGRENASPGALVLPPGAVEDRLRWLDTWPKLRPADAFAWLGLPTAVRWEDIVGAAYERFANHSERVNDFDTAGVVI